MKTLEDLGSFYTQTLLPDLAGLEEERKTVQASLRILAAVLAAAALAILGLWWRQTKDFRSLLFLLGLSYAALGALAALCYQFITSDYVHHFKSRIIDKLIGFLDSDLSYGEYGCVDQGVFVGSGMFKHWPEIYDGQDYISGKIGETQIYFSEIDARYETTDSKGNKTYPSLFKGLFLAADFNKKLRGMTFVLPDTAKNLLGSVLGQALQSFEHSFGNLVKLEDPDFNHEFVVYSSDQVEARYILTPTLMERLLKYKKMSDETLYVSFVGNRVHVAIPKSEDPFTPSIFGSLLEFGQVVRYYERLKIATRIVDDLHLNTRIWTRQE